MTVDEDERGGLSRMEIEVRRHSIVRSGWLAQAYMGPVGTEYLRAKSNSTVDLLPSPELWYELRPCGSTVL